MRAWAENARLWTGSGSLLKLLHGLIGCYYCELELFGYSVLIKDSIACNKIVQLICQGVSQMNKVCGLHAIVSPGIAV